MNQKKIGTILVVAGIIFLMFVLASRNREAEFIEMHMESTGSCFLADGTCLHAELNSPSRMLGFLSSFMIFSLGLYLIFFDKTQEILIKQNLKVSKALEEARKKEDEKDLFTAFLSAFSEDEKKVLLAIKEQDGILQSTLRYRTGLSKTSLSMMLKDFEEKEIVSKKPEGKTNKVFLRKKF